VLTGRVDRMVNNKLILGNNWLSSASRPADTGRGVASFIVSVRGRNHYERSWQVLLSQHRIPVEHIGNVHVAATLRDVVRYIHVKWQEFICAVTVNPKTIHVYRYRRNFDAVCHISRDISRLFPVSAAISDYWNSHKTDPRNSGPNFL